METTLRLCDEHYSSIFKFAKSASEETPFELWDLFQEFWIVYLECCVKFDTSRKEGYSENSEMFEKYIHTAFVRKVCDMWYYHFHNSGTSYERHDFTLELRKHNSFFFDDDSYYKLAERRVSFFDNETINNIVDVFEVEEKVFGKPVEKLEKIIDFIISKTRNNNPEYIRRVLLGHFRDGKQLKQIAEEEGKTKAAISEVVSRFCEKARKNDEVMAYLSSIR